MLFSLNCIIIIMLMILFLGVIKFKFLKNILMEISKM